MRARTSTPCVLHEFCFIRYDKQKYKNGATELQTKTVEKEPKDSFLTVNLPVASDPAVRDQCACVFRSFLNM